MSRTDQRWPVSPSVITAGVVADFPPNTVTAFPNGKFYLARREDGGFLALYQRCTHLACVVLWREAEKQFYCPCRGSRFQPDGAVLSRPASQSLMRFPVAFDGNDVLVDTGTLVNQRLMIGFSRHQPALWVAVLHAAAPLTPGSPATQPVIGG